MKNKISTEYAEALFMLALEQDKTEEYYKELTLVNDLFLDNPEYIALLVSPALEENEKLDLVDKAFSGLSQDMLNFIKLLISRGRISLIHMCFEEYERLFNASRKTMVVTVISAQALNDDEKQRITAKLEKKYGCKIELICEIDNSILGGIIIKTEDAVIDGSLKKKLRDVKEVIRK
ncbi:MAG: F0F1 ATP synthase subunit delta [Clostridia bacterium]|nr:F0F1 ATP synthase subunit delta [Clostridia bacterium]